MKVSENKLSLAIGSMPMHLISSNTEPMFSMQNKMTVEKVVKNVLIIEDDLFFANLLKELLQDQLPNENILIVKTVARGMFHLSEQKPDFVFLDNKLPFLNGVNAISLFKEISPDSKIVMMTGTLNKDLIANAYKNGSDYIIDKQHIRKNALADIFSNKCTAFLSENVYKESI